MPMCGERLAAAMSRAVPVSIAGAMLAAITVVVTMVIQWRAALPWRRELRQLAQPDGAGISLTTAAATTAAGEESDRPSESGFNPIACPRRKIFVPCKPLFLEGHQ